MRIKIFPILLLFVMTASLSLASSGDSCNSYCKSEYGTEGSCAWWCGGQYFYSGEPGLCVLSRCCCVEPDNFMVQNDDLMYYPDMYKADNNYTALVVGDLSDVNNSELIAGSLKYESEDDLGEQRNVTIATALDTEIEDPFNQDLISIGNACNNSVTNALMGSPIDCREGLIEGEGYIKLYNYNGHAQIVVTGYTPEDVEMASKVLANYSGYVLDGKSVIVRGTLNEPELFYLGWPYAKGRIELPVGGEKRFYVDFSEGHAQQDKLAEAVGSADVELFYSEDAEGMGNYGYEVYVANISQVRLGVLEGVYSEVGYEDCDALWGDEATFNMLSAHPKSEDSVVCVLTQEGQIAKLHAIEKDNDTIVLEYEYLDTGEDFGCEEHNDTIKLIRGQLELGEFENRCENTSSILDFSCDSNRGILEHVDCMYGCKDAECKDAPEEPTTSVTTTTIAPVTTTTQITPTQITPSVLGCCINPATQACLTTSAEICCPSNSDYMQMGGVGPTNKQECLDWWFFPSDSPEACSLITEEEAPLAEYCQVGCCCELLPDDSIYFRQEKQISCTMPAQYWMPFSDEKGCDEESCSDFISFTLDMKLVPPEPVNETICTGEGYTYCINKSGWDPNENVIVLTPDLPDGSNYDRDKDCFNWIPEDGQVGQYMVHLTTLGSKDNVVLDLTVDPCENICPELSWFGNLTALAAGNAPAAIYKPEPWIFCLNGSDEDDDNLSFKVEGLPAVFNENTNCINWTPKLDQVGVYNVTLTVSDGECDTSKTVSVEVIKGDLIRPLWFQGMMFGLIISVLLAVLALAFQQWEILPFLMNLLGTQSIWVALAGTGFGITVITTVVGAIIEGILKL